MSASFPYRVNRAVLRINLATFSGDRNGSRNGRLWGGAISELLAFYFELHSDNTAILILCTLIEMTRLNIKWWREVHIPLYALLQELPVCRLGPCNYLYHKEVQ